MSSRRSWPWLIAGAILVFTANLRWGINALAWFAPVPLLRYLRVTSGWRTRVGFVLAMTAIWTVTTAKITAGLPLAFALVGAPIGLVQGLAYVLADRLRRAHGDAWSLGLIPAAMIVGEATLQLGVLGLGTWGTAGNTQLGDLAVMQLASVFGLAGVSALVYAVAVGLELGLARVLDGRPVRAWLVAAPLAVALAVHAGGALRLATLEGATRRVAAVGTIATFDGSQPVDAAERARIVDTLARDTARAAAAGAEVIVWTEAAALATPAEEPALLARVRDLARAGHAHVVAAYIVERSREPLVFENKYAWARPDGTIAEIYWKHHPAPGEPSIVGTAPLAAIADGDTVLAGALCYDYDFPRLAQAHGALDVDLVALPSSDWRGIDPIHTQMAAVRAIEQGLSIVRSTRFGLSAAIDPAGRMRATASSFTAADRVMVAEIPRHGAPTIYRAIGDVLLWAALGAVAGGLALSFRRRRA